MTELSTENLAQDQAATRQASEFANLLLQEFRPKTKRAREAMEAAMRILAEHALEQTSLVSNDAIKSIESIIMAIDAKLTTQVNLIMHHANFQQLESAWRGLHYLVDNTETDEQLEIHALNISKPELHKTLKKFKGTTQDQSPIFKKLYEEEYSQFGGEPYDYLVGDYYFDQPPPDVELLGEMAKIPAVMHAPFIFTASPAVMDIGSWQELSNPHDLAKIFVTPEYTGWRSLRESEDSRYIDPTMPHFLARLPCGARTDPVEEFTFGGETDSANSSKHAWVDPAYAMAVSINRSFKLYGWCSRIRGVESGDKMQGLPTCTFPTDDGGMDMKRPAEITISSRRRTELAKNGFMSLLREKNTDFAVFIGAQSLQKPAEYDDPDATANANLMTRLPYLFTACRFAHYLKCIVRDKVGSFKEEDEMRRWLQSWILNYADGDPAHSTETAKAQHPLAAAEVVVEEIEGNLGYYNLELSLRPRYQLEELTVSLRLVSKLPSIKEA